MITNISIIQLASWLTIAVLGLLSPGQYLPLKTINRDTNSKAIPQGSRLPWGHFWDTWGLPRPSGFGKKSRGTEVGCT